MSLITFLILLAVEGLIVGALARLALPGPDPMSLLETMLVGVAGSFVAGLIGLALVGHAFGIVLSVLVATGIVYLVRRTRRSPLGGGLSRGRLGR